MIRKYHNHKLQTTPWHGEEGPPNHHEALFDIVYQQNKGLIRQDVTTSTNTYVIIEKARKLQMK